MQEVWFKVHPTELYPFILRGCIQVFSISYENLFCNFLISSPLFFFRAQRSSLKVLYKLGRSWYTKPNPTWRRLRAAGARILLFLETVSLLGKQSSRRGQWKVSWKTTEGFVVDPTDNKINQSGGAGGMLPSGSSLYIAKAFSSERDIFERQGWRFL